MANFQAGTLWKIKDESLGTGTVTNSYSIDNLQILSYDKIFDTIAYGTNESNGQITIVYINYINRSSKEVINVFQNGDWINSAYQTFFVLSDFVLTDPSIFGSSCEQITILPVQYSSKVKELTILDSEGKVVDLRVPFSPDYSQVRVTDTRSLKDVLFGKYEIQNADQTLSGPEKTGYWLQDSQLNNTSVLNIIQNFQQKIEEDLADITNVVINATEEEWPEEEKDRDIYLLSDPNIANLYLKNMFQEVFSDSEREYLKEMFHDSSMGATIYQHLAELQKKIFGIYIPDNFDDTTKFFEADGITETIGPGEDEKGTFTEITFLGSDQDIQSNYWMPYYDDTSFKGYRRPTQEEAASIRYSVLNSSFAQNMLKYNDFWQMLPTESFYSEGILNGFAILQKKDIKDMVEKFEFVSQELIKVSLDFNFMNDEYSGSITLPDDYKFYVTTNDYYLEEIQTTIATQELIFVASFDTISDESVLTYSLSYDNDGFLSLGTFDDHSEITIIIKCESTQKENLINSQIYRLIEAQSFLTLSIL